MENEEPQVRPARMNRRLRLKALLAEVGGPKKLQELTGVTDTHLIACAAGRRGIGDEMADKLERGTKKDFGWMDHPIHTGAVMMVTDVEAPILGDIRTIAKLNPTTFENLRKRLDEVASGALAADQILRQHGVTGYTDPERAAEKLKAPPVQLPADATNRGDNFAGGTSQFGDLHDEKPATKRRGS